MNDDREPDVDEFKCAWCGRIAMHHDADGLGECLDCMDVHVANGLPAGVPS